MLHATSESWESTMMKMICGAAFAALATTALATTGAMATELTVITAGDQNMVDYVNNYLAPIFEKENPGDTVKAVGTGPGDAGSQKIIERLQEIGRASCRGSVCQYVSISGVAGSLKKKLNPYTDL